jgi:hypothetical protein
MGLSLRQIWFAALGLVLCHIFGGAVSTVQADVIHDQSSMGSSELLGDPLRLSDVPTSLRLIELLQIVTLATDADCSHGATAPPIPTDGPTRIPGSLSTVVVLPASELVSHFSVDDPLCDLPSFPSSIFHPPRAS